MTRSAQDRPTLTDRPALLRQRDRANRRGFADILHRLAADEIQDRLSEINRRLTAPAVVTGFPDFWAQVLPDARVVSDEPVLDLQPGAHDLVVHAMALHWADDPVGQAPDAELRDALRKLSQREERVRRITRDIVLGKNK